jgi:hypothetical protein
MARKFALGNALAIGSAGNPASATVRTISPRLRHSVAVARSPWKYWRTCSTTSAECPPNQGRHEGDVRGMTVNEFIPVTLPDPVGTVNHPG